MSRYPAGECTDGAVNMAPWVDRYGNLGNARDWAANWRKNGGVTESTAHVGDVVAFQPGSDGASNFGHVAVVIALNGGGQFTIKEENGPAGLGRWDNRMVATVRGVDFLLQGRSAPTSAPPHNPQTSTPSPSTGSYIVTSGDTLSAIASHHGVSLQALEEANKQIGNFNLIHVGQIIHLPGTAAAAPAPAKAPAPAPKTAPVQQTYVVRRGDNLTAIAQKFRVSEPALYSLNKKVIGNNPNLIKPGQRLQIP